jgi:hypothetical protein
MDIYIYIITILSVRHKHALRIHEPFLKVPRVYQVEARECIEWSEIDRKTVWPSGTVGNPPVSMTCSAILNGIVTRTRIRDPDSLRTRNPHRSVPHFLHFDSSTRANVDGNCRLGPRKRRRCVPRIACSLQLPLLPFNINEVYLFIYIFLYLFFW